MRAKLVAVRLVAGIFIAGPMLAFAADLPKTGKFEFIACLAGKQTSIAHGPNHVVGTAEILGTQRSNPPGSLFDLTTSRCVYSYSSIDGKYAADGFCEFLDAQGDTYLLKVDRPPGQAGTLDGLHGTGKYSGMSLRGEYDGSASFPHTPGNVQTCVKAAGDFSFQ
jgi:hypothetical protein